MTEYEASSLALQEATLKLQETALKLQEASLAIQKASLAAQQASVWVAALVGFAQCALIAYGLYFMRQAARHRDAQHRETMEAMNHQHLESMAALSAQREAEKERHRETMEVLERQNTALMELIRRTSAPPPP